MKDRSALPRVAHLRDRHAVSLDRLASEQGETVESVSGFVLALAMDPTAKAVYLQTIVRWLLSGAIRFEDEERVRDILRRFDADKHRLPIEQRDIGRHTSPGDISDLLDPPDLVAVRDVPSAILGCSEVIGSGTNWSLFRLIAVPAAIWWADSTDWCTRHWDTAIRYMRGGGLHVIVVDGAKFQYELNAGQFMDRRDRPMHRRLQSFPTEALQAILTSAERHRSRLGGSFVRAGLSIEGWVLMELRRRGAEIDSTARNGWLSRDGSVHIVHALPTELRFSSWHEREPYTTYIVRTPDGEVEIGRKDFMEPNSLPQAIYDFLLADLEDGAVQNGPSTWTKGERAFSLLGDVWRDRAGRKAFYDDATYARVDGRMHLVWSFDEGFDVNPRSASIFVLDLERKTIEILRTRNDLKAASKSTREVVAATYRSSTYIETAFAKNFGLPTLLGGFLRYVADKLSGQCPYVFEARKLQEAAA